MSDNGRLTVAEMDVLVGRLRGVAMRLNPRGAYDTASQADDAATVGHAANIIDHLSLQYLACADVREATP
jgi:hypothetical protein